MPLGTLDRTPPPFFRQGPSALTKLAVFSALALFLMAADNRLSITQPVRAVIATGLLPVQQSLRVPVDLLQGGSTYLRGLDAAVHAERGAQLKLVQQSARAAQAEQLALENARLRALLELRPGLAVRSISAEIMYEAADPFSRKVFLDRGGTHGVQPGAPVVNEAGVLGQVTRVFPLSSEATLLVDKDAAIPVLNIRTQQRSAAFGGAEDGLMELRFMAPHADVQPGDTLVTSGIDGVYPPGLAVAQVSRVDRRADSGFARVLMRPAALADGVRHVLVLEPRAAQLPPRPDPAPETEAPPRRRPGGRR
jgi:rod shape-determining protein MreC